MFFLWVSRLLMVKKMRAILGGLHFQDYFDFGITDSERGKTSYFIPFFFLKIYILMNIYSKFQVYIFISFETIGD